MTETGHVHFQDNLLEEQEKRSTPLLSCQDLPTKLQECLASPNDVSKLDWIFPAQTHILADDLANFPPLTPSLMILEREEDTEEITPTKHERSLTQEVPKDAWQAREEYDEALQTACMFRAQAGRLLVRVEAATPHYGRRLAKMAAEMIQHAEEADRQAAVLKRHLAMLDDEPAAQVDMTPNPACLPMPESWTLAAAAKILRKEGKESLALDLEKLAARASGCAKQKVVLSRLDEGPTRLSSVPSRCLTGKPLDYFGKACSI